MFAVIEQPTDCTTLSALIPLPLVYRMIKHHDLTCSKFIRNWALNVRRMHFNIEFYC